MIGAGFSLWLGKCLAEVFIFLAVVLAIGVICLAFLAVDKLIRVRKGRNKL